MSDTLIMDKAAYEEKCRERAARQVHEAVNKPLKLWKHTGPGHYFGCVVIVAANTAEEAVKLVRAELDSSGLKDYPVKIVPFFIKEGVVYSDNGDY